MVESNSTALEKRQRDIELFSLSLEQVPSLLPVEIPQAPALPMEIPLEFSNPIIVHDAELKDGRTVLIMGKVIEIPAGTKDKMTGKALKIVLGCYIGSVIAIKNGDSWLRIRDDEVLAFPKESRVEAKVLPSYRTE